MAPVSVHPDASSTALRSSAWSSRHQYNARQHKHLAAGSRSERTLMGTSGGPRGGGCRSIPSVFSSRLSVAKGAGSTGLVHLGVERCIIRRFGFSVACRDVTGCRRRHTHSTVSVSTAYTVVSRWRSRCEGSCGGKITAGRHAATTLDRACTRPLFDHSPRMSHTTLRYRPDALSAAT